MDEIRKTGRVTIPTDLDVVPETLEIGRASCRERV